jgi:hypothetical protein
MMRGTFKILRGGVPKDFKYFSRQDIRFSIPNLAKTKYIEPLVCSRMSKCLRMGEELLRRYYVV